MNDLARFPTSASAVAERQRPAVVRRVAAAGRSAVAEVAPIDRLPRPVAPPLPGGAKLRDRVPAPLPDGDRADLMARLKDVDSRIASWRLRLAVAEEQAAEAVALAQAALKRAEEAQSREKAVRARAETAEARARSAEEMLEVLHEAIKAELSGI